MEETLHLLASRVPQPKQVPLMDSFAYRYAEKSLHQALVQKLARLISGLHSARLLMEHGFVQEQASLQRMLDEIEEDITFLSFSVIFNDFTPLHQEYLDAFYEEEFDGKTVIDSTQRRPMIPRKKIRAYIARVGKSGPDPSSLAKATRTISKTYSGYVHAASPQIMDIYGGNPPRFHVRGVQGTMRHDEHRKDIWNYFYRGIIAFAFCTKAFGDDQLFEKIQAFTRDFEKQSGESSND